MRARFFVRRDVVGVLGGRAVLDISIKKKKNPHHAGLEYVVPQIGFEPTAFCSGGRRSIP